jgi:hypothetical protein
VSVCVDGDLAVPVERDLQQLLRRVLAFGATIDLDRLVEAGARREDDLGVELALWPSPSDHLASCAVTEDVGVRARHGQHHALGHPLALHRQLRVDAGHHDVELGEQVVGQVERAVLEDVDLHAGEDAERRELLVQPLYLDELLAQAFRREPVGDREPW